MMPEFVMVAMLILNSLDIEAINDEGPFEKINGADK